MLKLSRELADRRRLVLHPRAGRTGISPKRIVVVGPLSPVVRAGFLRIAREHFDVVEIAAPAKMLNSIANHDRTAAVVLRRVDAADRGTHDSRIPWIGLSSLIRDVLVIEGDGVSHLENPTPEALCEFIGSRCR